MEDNDVLTFEERAIAEVARLVGVPPTRQTRAMKAGIKAETACQKAVKAATSEEEIAKAEEAWNLNPPPTVAFGRRSGPVCVVRRTSAVLT